MIEGTPSDKPKLKAVKEQPPAKKPEQVGFYFRYYIPNEDGRIKIVDVPQYKLMADHCFEQKKHCFDDSTALQFDGKKWDWLSKNALVNFIIKNNEECIKPAHLEGFTKMIRGKCLASDIATKNSDGLINVNNGIIEVKSGELLPHSHEYLFKYCSPVDFSTSASCPQWHKFLNETFQNDEDLIDLVQRMFGYILIGGRPFLHRAFVLYGTGRNGKSTFLDVLRAVLGTESYSTVSMAKIDKEFSVVSIDGKLANIVEETPGDEIDAEAFKNLVGGGEIQAAHKGFDEYKFRCNARFVFACNDMPVFKDKSVGLEDRLVFIPFNRYIEEGKRDTEITEKLLSELPGIFNWALSGAKTMLSERKLKNFQSINEAKENYRQETDPLYSWVIHNIGIAKDSPNISNSEVFEQYKKQMFSDGNRPYSKIKFFKRFREMLAKRCQEKLIFFDETHKYYEKVNGESKQFRGFNVISKIEYDGTGRDKTDQDDIF